VRLATGAPTAPLVAIARRFGIALAIVCVNWAIVLVERDGYQDAADSGVSVLDALYYTTVTLTTTGYGDITPVSTSARLVNALVVTPMRLAFVLVLVGTTIQVLTERSRQQFRLRRWRKQLKDHVVVIGYGTKGRSAVRELLSRGATAEEIVVVDPDPGTVDDANEAGLTAVVGDATKDDVLRQAAVHTARAVVVATARDDTAVLATLSSRRLAPTATITVAVREVENEDLVRQSGADAVVVSSAAAGRLLAIATGSPRTVEVIDDLLASGKGLDLVEREVGPGEVGRTPESLDCAVVAVVRGGRMLRYDDPDVGELRDGDQVVLVSSRERSARP
jgi:voltage-gated potassium channel